MRKLNEIAQDIKDKQNKIYRLQQKFDANPCKETATPLSNAKNNDLPKLRAEYNEALRFYNPSPSKPC